jgi:FAD/FMN-containing dehydrogenase
MADYKTVRFKTIEELKEHIKSNKPTFYFSSQTSTVIPYDKLANYLKFDGDFYLGDLGQLPSAMELRGDDLHIKGAVNWKDAREFLLSKGRDIKTSPTEELAMVNAGLATSCTGERCFMFGNLRGQVKWCKYLNYLGEEVELNRDNHIEEIEGLQQYQDEYKYYNEFKNAPYPRFERETDLMIGTEGQLGIVTEVILETTERVPLQHLFISLPKWEEDYAPHLEIIKAIQGFRDNVYLVELIDSNAFDYLKAEDRPVSDRDLIFFELKADAFDEFYENFLAKLKLINEEQIFELTENKFQQIRKNVPRAVFEENSRQGVVKMGTDVQVTTDQFQALMDMYREFTQVGIRYNLFGHFGDAHLHFNFMPLPADTAKCQSELERLYQKVLEWKGSPFAEHGIGLIKQKYIDPFYSSTQKKLFTKLKEKHDPHNQFFPQGFMSH